MPLKIAYLGHSGAGKTGSLASLLSSGYHLHHLDLDNKATILDDYISNLRSPYLQASPKGLWKTQTPEELASRYSRLTITEGYNIQGVNVVPRGDSYQKILNTLNNWVDGDHRPGNVSKWPQNYILVVDSFSRFCEAARNFHLALNGRLLQGMKAGTSDDNDYAAVYRYILNFCQLLKMDELQCHVILICHIVEMSQRQMPRTDDKSPIPARYVRGFPQVFGNAMISPQITQHFNTVLRAKSTQPPNSKHVIITTNDDDVETITTHPLRVKQEYPLETGLAEYFRDVQQQGV